GKRLQRGDLASRDRPGGICLEQHDISPVAFDSLECLPWARVLDVVAAGREQEGGDAEEPAVAAGEEYTQRLEAEDLAGLRVRGRARGHDCAGCAVSRRSPTAIPRRPASPAASSRTAYECRH